MALRMTLYWTMVALTLATPAYAANDTKAYHGSVCQPSGSSDADRTTISYFGATCTAFPCYLECPLTRDRVSDVDTFVDLAIEVYNSTATNAYSCTMFAMNEDASSGSFYDSETVSVAATGRQQLYVGSALDANAGSEGSYMVQCVLDVDDTLHQLTIAETTDSGGTD